MRPREIINRFDAYLHKLGLELNAVIIGGAALNLIGVISRETRDCDIMDPCLSEEVAGAACEFAQELSRMGTILDADWLNDMPSLVKDQLPKGWRRRLQKAYEGKAIHFQTLGRLYLLRTKVFAFCDRSIDLEDCISLAPTPEELAEIQEWLEEQDANPDWPEHVRESIANLALELSHASEKKG